MLINVLDPIVQLITNNVRFIGHYNQHFRVYVRIYVHVSVAKDANAIYMRSFDVYVK